MIFHKILGNFSILEIRLQSFPLTVLAGGQVTRGSGFEGLLFRLAGKPPSNHALGIILGNRKCRPPIKCRTKILLYGVQLL